MDINALKDQLIRDEGLQLKPYLDTAGKWTIGAGRNLTDNGISSSEADAMLTNDILSHMRDMDQAIPWWAVLSQSRQLVMASMCFNMGITRLLTFKKFLAAAQAGNYKQAAVEMLNSKWAVQVGDRAKRLAALMESG